MAAELSSMRKRRPGGIMTHLSSAACEWFLIFLLFVDAVFSYMLREYAKYCELQSPCRLCSGLDHVFGEKKLGCSWSLVCSSHKEEISSLVFCSLHGELADFRGLCEECFKSIAMQKDSECKLLVGKLWVDVEGSFVQKLKLDKHVTLGSRSRTCSCCNETWLAAKSDDESLLEHEPVGLGGYKANVEPPLPLVPGRRRFSRRDGIKRLREKLTASMRHRKSRNNSVGTLSRVGYTEFKLTSDSEPESPLPEVGGGDGNSSSFGDNHTRLEHGVEFGRRDHPGVLVNNVISEKLTYQGSEMKDQPGLLDLDELKTVNPLLSDAMTEHASGGYYSLAESQPKRSLRWTKDVISLDRVPQPPDVGSLGASAESSNVSLPNYSTFSEVSDSIRTVPSASSTVRITRKSIYIEETCKRVNISATMNIEATAGTSSDDSTCSSYSYSKNLTGGGLCHCPENMYLTEEDTKSMPRASKSELALLLKDAGSGHEESRKDEDCSSQSLPLPVSLKRSDSSFESSDGLGVSEIEGESIIDQLRRQVEHDRSCMKSLYEELEEERNAADIAANQAMAMITRLQEEKAAVEMEALQYMRMMEIHAEYDMESLERDLLSELQELQTELEFYRNGSGLEDLREETDCAARSEYSPGTSGDSESAKFSKTNGKCDPMSSSVSEFGDENLYVSHSLKKLVKNLYKDYCSEKVEDTPKGLDFYKIKDVIGPTEDLLNDSSADAKENYFHNEKNDSILVKEIATLDDRLEEVETDHDSLKCRSNLPQDRPHQLQKLR